MSTFEEPAEATTPARGDRPGPRLVAAVVLAVLVTLFAVFNLDQVQVNWIVGTWETPLIVVIVLSALLGAIAGGVLQHRSTRG